MSCASSSFVAALMRDSMSCVITPLRFSLSRLILALTTEKNSVSCFSRNSVTGNVAAAL